MCCKYLTDTFEICSADRNCVGGHGHGSSDLLVSIGMLSISDVRGR